MKMNLSYRTAMNYQNFSIKCIFWVYLFVPSLLIGQTNASYDIKTIAFWNLENLFDTVNDSLVLDDERTPTGAYHWTKRRYHSKIERLAKIVLKMSFEGNSGPDLLGICEVENREVVADFVQTLNKSKNSYRFIHEDSPDLRGIDVALVYKEEHFIPVNYVSRRLLLYDDLQRRKYTRDQLVVYGYLNGEAIYVLVNHWPSRSGGEERSKPFRMAAAKLNLKIIDSIRTIEPHAKIVSMGDFNDDPTSDSFKKVLQTNDKRVGGKTYNRYSLYDPMEALYKKGVGSLAYRDTWNLFDQFYMSETLLDGDGYQFLNASVFKPLELLETTTPYKGYPKRTYHGTTYHDGYSDHFPVLMYMVKYN